MSVLKCDDCGEVQELRADVCRAVCLKCKGIMNPLKADKEPASEVPCSVGLEGLLEERQGWVKIEDRLPEAYKRVLVLHNNGYIHFDEVDGDGTGRKFKKDDTPYVDDCPYSHWMPLPELPEAD